MNSRKFVAETLSGKPIFTTGRKLTLEDTGTRASCLEADNPEETAKYWSKRMGEPCRAVATDVIVEYINV